MFPMRPCHFAGCFISLCIATGMFLVCVTGLRCGSIFQGAAEISFTGTPSSNRTDRTNHDLRHATPHATLHGPKMRMLLC